MADPARKLNQEVQSELFVSKPKESSRERIKATHTSEIVFALCGYLGSNIKSVSDSLKYIMENDYGYKCEVIKLSKFITLNKGDDAYNATGSPEYVRIKNLIENGNKIRSKFGNEILAELAIQKIGLDRLTDAEKIQEEGEKEHLQFKSQKKCFIIESIKNPSELEVLKEVYRNLIYTIGIFSPYKIRHENLRQKEITEQEIVELVDQDSQEEKSNGQGVRKTFTKSDYFLRIDSSSQSFLSAKLKRFIHLIFETAIITPTKDETAMYLASSASANSACLSRQVGASIVDESGNVISVGWNDVPCFEGNLYTQQNSVDIQGENDYRCLNFQNGKCMNDIQKDRISKNLLNELLAHECITEENKEKTLKIIEKSRLGGLIEFSRAIHAEMHAIIIGSQKTGDKMIRGKLFCTTYPCHNCARHIVLAGITEVYFIEPYKKSLATLLHSDSISEDENDKNKVRILLYDGVSPNRYKHLFRMTENKRKDINGEILRPKLKEATPKYTETLEALYTLESTATKNLKDLNLKIKEN